MRKLRTRMTKWLLETTELALGLALSHHSALRYTYHPMDAFRELEKCPVVWFVFTPPALFLNFPKQLPNSPDLSHATLSSALLPSYPCPSDFSVFAYNIPPSLLTLPRSNPHHPSCPSLSGTPSGKSLLLHKKISPPKQTCIISQLLHVRNPGMAYLDASASRSHEVAVKL